MPTIVKTKAKAKAKNGWKEGGPVRTYDIAEGSSRTQKIYRNKKTTWADLQKKLGIPTKTNETADEYARMGKDEQSEIKDVGGFVGGYLQKGSRKAVLRRSLLTLDIDSPNSDFISQSQMILDGLAFVIYLTHSSRPEKPRYRLVLPLARDVTIDEYEAVGRKFAEMLGIEQFDPTTFEPGRMMYWPSCSSDAEYVYETGGETPLDPDEILAKYTDWRDVSSWASPTAGEKVRLQAEKRLMQDISQKKGFIGAFCRAYTMHEAIAKFVPEYRRCETDPNRYSYTPGSTANGVVIYNDMFAYSHHATDPICGREVNAWDLVRLHRFGALDADAKSDTPVSRLPSYKKMMDLAKNDPRTKIQLIRDREEEVGGDFDAEPDETGEDAGRGWLSRIKLGDNEKPIPNAKNVELILMNDPGLKGKIGFDEFKGMEAARVDLPWRKVGKMNNALTDSDDAELRVYLSKKYELVGERVIRDGVTSVARREENRFHPVRGYLNGLTWDGISRLERLLIDYFGVEDTPYVRTVTKKTFLGAVARVFQPGVKFDTMLVLKGPQGCGKSTFFRILAKNWFSDSLKDIKSKDAMDGLRGVWIVEISELAAMRKADSEDIKSFISRQKDLYRPAYGRRAEEFPRQNIFVATTNEPNFLRDRTGNRRFWPVWVPKNAAPIKDVFTDLMSEVDQIWAEAKALYDNGTESLYLSGEESKAAARAQELFMQEDPRREVIAEYLDRLLPTDWDDKNQRERVSWLNDRGKEGTVLRTRVCAEEIWIEALSHDDAKDLNRGKVIELNQILDSLPDWEKSDKVLKFNGYGVRRGFIRVPK